MIGLLAGQGGAKSASVSVLSKKATVVGRGEECEVLISDRSVSRRHAQIDRDGDGYQLQDLDSRNGTTVNGISVVYKRLRNHDVIRFGDIEMVFHETEEDVRPAPQAIPELGAGAGPVDLTVALALPASKGRHSGSGAIEAWKTVREFANAGVAALETHLEGIAEDLAGMSAIHHVLIHVPAGVLARGERFIRRGERERSASVEERVRGVSLSAKPVLLQGGKTVAKAAEGCQLDIAFLPIRFSPTQCGCLVIEPVDVLGQKEVELAVSISEAIEIGYRLLVPAAVPARPQKSAAETSAAPAVEIIGRSAALQEVIRQTRRAARTDSTVLIRGETGTGKELIARLIYDESSRRGKPFLRVNISAIQADLMSDELFGHVKGAFSDALADRKGYFEEADGGTLFLDEIGELSADVQVKLLRVMQEGEFMRLGSNATRKTNVRLIAATNRDLEAEVRKGSFRQDLYYRLNVIEIRLPPLRERSEDIPNLAQFFLQKIRLRANSHVQAISPGALAALQSYAWRGNIRELQNVIERAMVLAEGTCLEESDLQLAPAALFATATGGAGEHGNRALRTLDEVERDHIALVLAACKSNMSEAARVLGISRSALYAKMGRGAEGGKAS